MKPIPQELRHLPEVRWVRAGLLLLTAAAFVLLPATWSSSKQGLAGIAIVWAMAGVSLVILTGWGGHISLGQFAFVGVGAMVSGNLVSHLNLDLFIALLAAGAAGAAVALDRRPPCAADHAGCSSPPRRWRSPIAMNSYVININNFPDFVPQDVERQYLWERFDLERQLHDVPAVPRVPGAVDAGGAWASARRAAGGS